MKYTEFQKMQKEEIAKKIEESRLELMKLNAQLSMGTTPKSTKQIREIKRNLARFETLRSENFRKDLDAMKTDENKKSTKSKVSRSSKFRKSNSSTKKYVHK